MTDRTLVDEYKAGRVTSADVIQIERKRQKINKGLDRDALHDYKRYKDMLVTATTIHYTRMVHQHCTDFEANMYVRMDRIGARAIEDNWQDWKFWCGLPYEAAAAVFWLAVTVLTVALLCVCGIAAVTMPVWRPVWVVSHVLAIRFYHWAMCIAICVVIHVIFVILGLEHLLERLL